MNILEKIKGGLIVSCQASEGWPFYGANYMERMAVAAYQAGAVGIRANGPNDIKKIKDSVPLPIIGIYKISNSKSDVIITPSIDSASVIIEAGADIVAVDATDRRLPDGKFGYDLIEEIKKKFNVLVMADVSTLEEGKKAQEAGADMVSSTLAGYTSYTMPPTDGPDYEVLRLLAENLNIPVICEGRIWTREEAVKAFKLGAYSIVVGTAITAPQLITARFVEAISKDK